mmetsp:Transcript_15186/g.52636  ORF Transcript_15186/g.52636 Transcript_15186/m.52636 type:complete len:257 (+) Transcript_15186:1037-1807(+)
MPPTLSAVAVFDDIAPSFARSASWADSTSASAASTLNSMRSTDSFWSLMSCDTRPKIDEISATCASICCDASARRTAYWSSGISCCCRCAAAPTPETPPPDDTVPSGRGRAGAASKTGTRCRWGRCASSSRRLPKSSRRSACFFTASDRSRMTALKSRPSASSSADKAASIDAQCAKHRGGRGDRCGSRCARFAARSAPSARERWSLVCCMRCAMRSAGSWKIDDRRTRSPSSARLARVRAVSAPTSSQAAVKART